VREKKCHNPLPGNNAISQKRITVSTHECTRLAQKEAPGYVRSYLPTTQGRKKKKDVDGNWVGGGHNALHPSRSSPVQFQFQFQFQSDLTYDLRNPPFLS